MGDQQFPNDRRKHLRVAVPHWIYAFCQESECALGRVTDISKGGLAIHYLTHPEGSADWPMASVNLDLFESGTTRRLRGFEAKVIYNIDVPQPDTLRDTLQLRRCGFEFETLSGDQHGELESFIANFTLGRAEG